MPILTTALLAHLVFAQQIEIPPGTPEHGRKAIERVNAVRAEGDEPTPTPVPAYSRPSATTYEITDDGSNPKMYRYFQYLRGFAGCARPNQRCEEAAKKFKNGGEELAEFLLYHYEQCLSENHVNCATFLRQSAHTNSATAWNYITTELEKPKTELGERMNDLILASGYTEAPRALSIGLDVLATETDERTRSFVVASMQYCLLYAPFHEPADQLLRDQAVEKLIEMEKSSGGEPRSVRVAAFSALEHLERKNGDSLRAAPVDLP